MSIFFDRITLLCKQQGETLNSFARKVGIPSGSVTAWKRGTVPRANNLDKIAGFFNVSVDYLLGNDAAAKKATAPEGDGSSNPDFDVFLKTYEGLSPAKQSLVQSLVRELASAEARADDSQD